MEQRTRGTRIYSKGENLTRKRAVRDGKDQVGLNRTEGENGPPPSKRTALGDVSNRTRGVLGDVSNKTGAIAKGGKGVQARGAVSKPKKVIANKKPQVVPALNKDRPSSPPAVASDVKAASKVKAGVTSGHARLRTSVQRRSVQRKSARAAAQLERKRSLKVAVPASQPSESAAGQPGEKENKESGVINLKKENVASTESPQSKVELLYGLVQSELHGVDRVSEVGAVDRGSELQGVDMGSEVQDVDEDFEVQDVDEDSEVQDVDEDSDYFHSPEYGKDIFKYYKSREGRFRLEKFLKLQPTITEMMRTILNDWMVEIQENFELNHEILYLASKLTDHYLARVIIKKDRLQLVAAAATFVACKYDERIPPLVDDFLYLCDDAYTKKDFLAMERSILSAVNFELGMTLSYRLLRRYARCCKADMRLLTLARYILETSLLHYSLVQIKESLVASGALYLAFIMSKSAKTWDATLSHYSGYGAQEVAEVAVKLNDMLHLMDNAPYCTVCTIRNKYSNEVFHSVALIPLVPKSTVKELMNALK